MELKEQIKQQVIDALNLDVAIEDFDDNKPLFGEEGLGLDSIDVLELIVLLERNYGIKISDPKEGKQVFTNISTMTDYIEKNRKK
ncbi:MAG: acyl carrier protein [Paludibacteraceae bacterium]|nr:acyl carrier protein [Paludibacteraceae bacterium]